MKIGKNFEESAGGIITLSKFKCSLCNNNYYFLKTVKTKKGNEQYCNFCYAIVNGWEKPLSTSRGSLSSISNNMNASASLTRSSLISGMSGIMLMISGIAFIFFSIGSEGANLISFAFGSGTSVAGFILFRRFISTT